MRKLTIWVFLSTCLFFYASGVFGHQEDFVDYASMANNQGEIVVNVHYDLNKHDPGRIESVSFTLQHTIATSNAETVQVQLVSGSNRWYICHSRGYAWSCDTNDLPLLSSVNQVRVRSSL